MFRCFLDIERVVPIDHILASVVPFSEVCPQSVVSQLFNVEWMVLVVRTYHLFEHVPLFEFKCVEVHYVFENALTSVVFRDKLD